MLQAQVSQDVVQGAFDASFPADDSVKATEVPTPPTQHDLKKALPVALSLIKLASTFTAAQALGGRPKPRPRTDLVAEKIKTMSSAPNEALHPVKVVRVSAERGDLFVQRGDGAPKLPAGAGEQHDGVEWWRRRESNPRPDRSSWLLGHLEPQNRP